ncbi:MAG: hypothetical protein RL192_48, partial [Actinomycetota bacterium]
MSQRNVLIFVNSARAEAKNASETIISKLSEANIKVFLSTDSSIPAVELVLVLGGDGT